MHAFPAPRRPQLDPRPWLCIAAAWLVGPPATPGATLHSGATITATISQPVQVDVHEFDAAAGDTVILRMTGIGGTTFSSALELRAPGGWTIDSAFSFGVAQIAASLTVTGKHTVACREHSGRIGPYALSMARLPNWPLVAADRDLGPIEPGPVYVGTITAPSDIDAASFAAAAGDTVRVRMQGIGAGAFDSVIELRGPEGALLASGMSFGQAAIEYVLTRSGIYSLLCHEFSDGTGPYALSLDLAGGHTRPDLDSDGVHNVGELAAGTDPFDPASAFRFTQAGVEQAGLRLRWTTVGGRRYRLQAGASPAFDAVEEIVRPGAEEIEQDASEGEPHWMEHLLPAALVQAPAAPGTRAYRVVIVDP